jgi:hypothetical protein
VGAYCDFHHHFFMDSRENYNIDLPESATSPASHQPGAGLLQAVLKEYPEYSDGSKKASQNRIGVGCRTLERESIHVHKHS